MKRNIIIYIASALLIILFLYASISKLVEYSEFKRQLHYSPYISGFAPFLALSLPAVEILVSLMLILNKTRLWGLYASFILMTAFSAYIGYMLAFASIEEVPCPCGGILGEMSWSTHLIFNLFFCCAFSMGYSTIQEVSCRYCVILNIECPILNFDVKTFATNIKDT